MYLDGSEIALRCESHCLSRATASFGLEQREFSEGRNLLVHLASQVRTAVPLPSSSHLTSILE